MNPADIDATVRHTRRTGSSLDHIVRDHALRIRDRLDDLLAEFGRFEVEREQFRKDLRDALCDSRVDISEAMLVEETKDMARRAFEAEQACSRATRGRINPGPCSHCPMPRRSDGADQCLGWLPGVWNACCGHGVTTAAYVQFPPIRIAGRVARVCQWVLMRFRSKVSL